MKLTLQQLEAHLWGAANILRGKTAGQDYKNYILSLMFYKRLCDQWECEAEEAIAELERQQGRAFSDAEQAVFRSRGDHRYPVPQDAGWGKNTTGCAASTSPTADGSVKPPASFLPRGVAMSAWAFNPAET